MTRDLEKGTDNVAVSGRVVLSIRTDGIASPAFSPPPQPAPQLSISTAPSHATSLAHSPSLAASMSMLHSPLYGFPHSPTATPPTSTSSLAALPANQSTTTQQQHAPQRVYRAHLNAVSGPISTAGAIVSATPRRRLTLAEHRRGAAGVHAIDDALGTPAAAAFQSSPSLDTSLATLSLFDSPSAMPSSSSSSSPATAATDPLLGPLPEGWEVGLTAAGRTYFINHAERKTTWHDPRKAALRLLAKEREREARRVRAEREVQRAAAAAPAVVGPSLVAVGGEGYDSASNGGTAGASSAGAQQASGDSAPSGTTTSLPARSDGTTPAASSSSTTRSGSSPTTTGATSSSQVASPTLTSPTSPLSVSEEQLGSLPSGWERRVTPSGRAYFVDHNVSLKIDYRHHELVRLSRGKLIYEGDLSGGPQTKTTTWDDPRVPSLNPESDQTKRDFRRKLASYQKLCPPHRA